MKLQFLFRPLSTRYTYLQYSRPHPIVRVKNPFGVVSNELFFTSTSWDHIANRSTTYDRGWRKYKLTKL